jgi:hypothetical protein
MTRPPVGLGPQAASRTAVAAHVASRLAGTGSSRSSRDTWLQKDLRVKLRSNGLDRAAQRTRPAIRPWLLVDEPRLDIDLEKAMLIFPGSGVRRPTLVGQLRASGVIRQLLITRSRRDVICIAVYRSGERDQVFQAIEAFGESFIWEDVLDEDRGLERRMWAELARRLARDERLLG